MAEKPLLSFEQLMKDMEKLDMVEFKEKYGCEKPELKGLLDKMWLDKLSSFQIQELENKIQEFAKAIKEVEIFEPGHHNGKTFTEAEIDEIITSTNKMIKEQNLQIPIKLGHSKEQSVAKQIFGDDNKGMPALGWVKNLKKKGKKIVADLTDIPEKLYDLLKEKMWNTRSIELWEGFVSQAGKNVGSVITGLALLGAETPAVTALATLFEQDGEVKTYSSESTEIEKGEEEMTEENKSTETVVETPVNTEVETVVAEENKENIEMSKEKENEKLREYKRKADEGAEAIRELNEFKKQVKISEDTAFIDSLAKEGKLLPFQADVLKSVLVEIDDKPVKYFDKEIEEEVSGKSKELLKEFLKSLPNQVEFKEFSKGNGKNKTDVDVMVKDYQAKNPNVDIADAYKIVCRENNIDINTL